jgi:hypothetical protein
MRMDQYSSLMEIRCDIRAIHTMIGASPNNPPGIPEQSLVANTMECSEALPSLGGYLSKCSVSSSKVVNQFRDYASSLLPFLAIIEADLEGREPEPELPSSAIPIPTEEGEFLANMTGDTDEFGVLPYCLLPRRFSDSRDISFADIINPTSLSASRIVKLLVGFQEHRMQMYVVEK